MRKPARRARQYRLRTVARYRKVHDSVMARLADKSGADQSYRLLVEAMNEGAVILNLDGRILYSNSRFASMLATRLEKTLGMHFSDFVSVGHRLTFSEYFRRACNTPATVEIVLHARRRQPLGVRLSSNPVRGDVKGVCIVVTDITAHKHAEDARTEMAKQVLLAQERERQRVARELHDSVNQLLSTTRHRAQALAGHVNAGDRELQGRLQELTQLLERTMKEVRLISRNLRPSELDDLGLIPALNSLVDEVRERSHLKVRLRTPAGVPALSPQVELTIYRIAQEALSNAENHAGASKVNVVLECGPGSLSLRVQDNGRGFSLARENKKFGGGLLNMRERASFVGGTLDINAQRGKGTSITFQTSVQR